MTSYAVPILLFLTPQFALADNHTNPSDPIFDLSDGWSIAAIAMLSILGILILIRVARTCIVCEVQEVARIEDPLPR